MHCSNCGNQIAENSNFCYFCGTRQHVGGARPMRGRRLYRSATDKNIAGVLGGFAEYMDLDPTMVRVVFVLVTFFTGMVPGMIVYGVAWLVMSVNPDGQTASAASAPAAGRRKRLTRSVTDRKWAGVCGGLGEYLDVDPTIVRIIWVVLSIIPGTIIGGLIVYFLAWILMPEAQLQYAAPEAQREAVPHSS